MEGDRCRRPARALGSDRSCARWRGASLRRSLARAASACRPLCSRRSLARRVGGCGARDAVRCSTLRESFGRGHGDCAGVAVGCSVDLVSFRRPSPLRTSDSAAFAESMVGTRSLPSRQAFLRGREALDRWDLDAADSAFAIAKRWDSHFPQAALWSALTRRWSNKDGATWQYAVAVADAGRADLVEGDQDRLDALKALVAGRQVEACTKWDDLARRQPFAFANWYGAADCLAKDQFVRRDPRSPSGWQFRSGYHAALERYRRAVSLQPALLFSFRANEFERVRRWLWTSGYDLRLRSFRRDRSRDFAAFPSWDGDTLAFVPFPWKCSPARIRSYFDSFREPLAWRSSISGISSAISPPSGAPRNLEAHWPLISRTRAGSPRKPASTRHARVGEVTRDRFGRATAFDHV